MGFSVGILIGFLAGFVCCLLCSILAFEAWGIVFKRKSDE